VLVETSAGAGIAASERAGAKLANNSNAWGIDVGDKFDSLLRASTAARVSAVPSSVRGHTPAVSRRRQQRRPTPPIFHRLRDGGAP
jgi:hypothetical protein